ncbi:MAG: hypothetical protein PHP42_10705 [Bacteroidota bacterium]|nr:hypothetical protein [Bacteroidota bacterium]
MTDIPRFKIYGQDNPSIEETIQPRLSLRSWDGLEKSEKEIAYQQILNVGWLNEYSTEILSSITHLNFFFLKQCPGKNLHNTPPKKEHRSSYGEDFDRTKAALIDFKEIFLNEKSEALVFRMLSVFAANFINDYYLIRAEKELDNVTRQKYIENAFEKFDRLSNCLNHIFDQFFINAVLTRSGLVPKQDNKITENVYVPTLQILADPKWKSVSNDLSDMFTDYREKNYPETITKAHRVVQRFLQILVGEEGSNAKGELSKLFATAKSQSVIPVNRFTEPIINVFQGFVVSERATNSTAKPAIKDATSSDALLVMNVVMIFLQHCLQKNK